MAVLVSLRTVSDVLNRVVIVFCIGCVLVMLGISFVGFFYMITTGRALPWTYSLARLFIPWIGMLSITVAFKGAEHVAMTALVERLPARVAWLMRAASLVVVALFALALVWFGTDYWYHSTQYFMVSAQMQVHHKWVTGCVPITGLVLLIHLADGTRLLGRAESVEQAMQAAELDQRTAAALQAEFPGGEEERGR
jgi:TRAP-type C4-dicarboxylate transport system permease small subunit